MSFHSQFLFSLNIHSGYLVRVRALKVQLAGVSPQPEDLLSMVATLPNSTSTDQVKSPATYNCNENLGGFKATYYDSLNFVNTPRTRHSSELEKRSLIIRACCFIIPAAGSQGGGTVPSRTLTDVVNVSKGVVSVAGGVDIPYETTFASGIFKEIVTGVNPALAKVENVDTTLASPSTGEIAFTWQFKDTIFKEALTVQPTPFVFDIFVGDPV